MISLFYKTKLYLIVMLLLSSVKVYSSETIPKPLNENDKSLYTKIFSLQEDGDFQKANQLIKKVENKILLGRVKAQKYLHPTRYTSKFTELKEWLSQYNDHPSASRIYWLSNRKKPKSLKPAKKPESGYLSGFGNADVITLRPRIPSSYSGRSSPSTTRQIAYTIRKHIRNSWPSGALEVLNKNSSRKVLTDKEESQLHWEIANAYFIFNKDYEAIREASKSLVISNGQNDTAWLTAGLASWRRGDFKRSRLFFSNLANLKNSRDSIRSMGAYWASRSEFKNKNSKEAIKYLKISSKYPDTFYGKLAINALGYNHDFDFDLPSISKGFISWFLSQEGGKRTFALLRS